MFTYIFNATLLIFNNEFTLISEKKVNYDISNAAYAKDNILFLVNGQLYCMEIEGNMKPINFDSIKAGNIISICYNEKIDSYVIMTHEGIWVIDSSLKDITFSSGLKEYIKSSGAMRSYIMF